MSTSTPKAVTLPEQFGRYRILRQLGQGGMGSVYLARDTRLERNVALKVCTLTDHAQGLERFRREARAAAALRHANLCPVYDFDVQDGIAYITMAYIEGAPLNRWLAEHPLDAGSAALMVRKLAVAMQAAHDGGVVHRDLKPGNVVMDARGEPIILDFGLARLADSHSVQTQSGSIVGTPSHMAPEQAQSNPSAIGPATDIYALGVVLYEMLTGTVPFVGSPWAVIAQVLNAAPRPPRELNPAVPPELESVCLKALAKKPEERFPSMQTFAEALDQTVSDRPLHTVPRLGLPPTQQIARPGPETLALQQPRTLAVPPLPGRTRRWRRLAIPSAALLLLAGLTALWIVMHRGRDVAGKGGTKNNDAGNVNSLGMKFVHLSPGTFFMGGGADKKGTKTEIKEDFEIAVYPVTQGQWQALMGKNPSYFSRTGKGHEAVKNISDEDLKQFPVESVSWDNAQEFIRKLNEKESQSGWDYRLPSEAEWEYACRGGAVSEKDCNFDFYFDQPTNTLTSKLANFKGDYPLGRPTKVGSYPPNRLGLYDMHGNVWQWCRDRYTPNTPAHAFRGGSWDNDESFCRARSREWYAPNHGHTQGFRVVRAARSP